MQSRQGLCAPPIDITVRPLVPADLETLVPLFADYLDFYSVTVGAPEQTRFLAGRLAAGDSIVLGAFRANKLVGFALCHHTHNSLRLAPAWILHDLFVITEARRNHIAGALLDEVHRRAKAAGAVEVLLGTAHDNHAAKALYRKAEYVADTKFGVHIRDLGGEA